MDNRIDFTVSYSQSSDTGDNGVVTFKFNAGSWVLPTDGRLDAVGDTVVTERQDLNIGNVKATIEATRTSSSEMRVTVVFFAGSGSYLPFTERVLDKVPLNFT